MITTLSLIHPLAPVHLEERIERVAARALVEHQGNVLLLYTERYQDYSFPGGGLDLGEDLATGLARELIEETGAVQPVIGEEFIRVEELRPHHRPAGSLMRMRSHYFFCQIEPELAATQMEDYEQANGMRPVWVDLCAAIAHNLSQMAANSEHLGLSIARETQVMESWQAHRQRQLAAGALLASAI